VKLQGFVYIKKVGFIQNLLLTYLWRRGTKPEIER